MVNTFGWYMIACFDLRNLHYGALGSDCICFTS